MKYIFLDTETGGLDPSKNALLTVGMVVQGDDGDILGTLHLNIHPEDFIVEADALLINKINMMDHLEKALSRKDAARSISAWVSHYFGEKKPHVVGHNTSFDLGFLDQLFRETNTPIPYSYRSLDTMGNALFIKSLGVSVGDKLGLEALMSFYGIHLPDHETLHNALTDAKMTRLVFLAQQSQLSSLLSKNPLRWVLNFFKKGGSHNTSCLKCALKDDELIRYKTALGGIAQSVHYGDSQIAKQALGLISK